MVRYVSLTCVLLLLLGGSAGAQPRIEVHEGITIVPGSQGIPDNTGTVEVGLTPVAEVKAKTFTVRNTGNAALTLTEPISLPAGYTLLRSFGSTTLAAGQSTTFTVGLNAATAGRYGTGQISFNNNDTTRTPFNFTLTGAALAPPSVRILDNADSAFRAVGPWLPGNGQDWGFQGGVRYIPAGTGTNVVSWTFKGLTPGLYQVSATWVPSAVWAPDARYTIRDGSTSLGTVMANQTSGTFDFTDGAAGWKNLGSAVMITGETLVVQLSDQAMAGSNVVADAVRIQHIGFHGMILDNASATGFATAGTWGLDTRRGFQGNSITRGPGAGNSATWTFTGLAAGQYRVSASWREAPSRATNASYTITGGAAPVLVTLDQRQAPKDYLDGAARWTDLGPTGTVYSITGSTLSVQLATDTANGTVCADAIRVERVNTPVNPNISDVVRLLEQATWGPDSALQASVRTQGFNAYLNAQFAATPSSHPPYIPYPTNSNQASDGSEGWPGCGIPGTTPRQRDAICFRMNYTPYPYQRRFFTNALYGNDQLRQRVSWALYKFLVSGARGGEFREHGARVVPYLWILDFNSFGNFRDILSGITLNVHMGDYLDMIRSTRTRPNENYARELLQLFSVGLDEMYPDGTYLLDAQGNRLPTYTQAGVEEFTRALTGWTFPPQFATGVPNWIDPMVVPASGIANVDFSAKTLLQRSPQGQTILAGPNPPVNPGTIQYAQYSVQSVIDNVFHHPNCGPFVAKHLIQSLVTSNPSPGYVGRVTQVFNANRASATQLREVVRAILLDPEARGDIKADPNYGKLREPVLLLNGLCRAFGTTAYNGTGQSDGYLNPQVTIIDEDVYRPLSVFSYFMPDNLLSGSPSLLAPEFMIYSTLIAFRTHNVMNTMLNPNGADATFGIPATTPPDVLIPNGTKLNLASLTALAGTPAQMIAEINRVLFGGRMPAAMQTSILNAVNAVPAASTLKRAKTALYLVVTSPEFMVQR